MSRSADDGWARVVQVHRNGGGLALVFDYDGTLTPIVDHPAAAGLDDRVADLLADLARRPRVVVGIASGRSLDDLRRMVRVDGLLYSGSSGLEMEVDGRRIVDPTAAAACPVMAELAGRLDEAMRGFLGAWVERKPFGLTVHYRAVPDEHMPELRAQTRRLLEACGGGIRLTDAVRSLEVGPAVGRGKGAALRWIAGRAPRPTAVVYAGDSVGDADAFAACLELGGVAIAVGPEGPPEASHRLATPSELVSELFRLREVL